MKSRIRPPSPGHRREPEELPTRNRPTSFNFCKLSFVNSPPACDATASSCPTSLPLSNASASLPQCAFAPPPTSYGLSALVRAPRFSWFLEDDRGAYRGLLYPAELGSQRQDGCALVLAVARSGQGSWRNLNIRATRLITVSARDCLQTVHRQRIPPVLGRGRRQARLSE